MSKQDPVTRDAVALAKQLLEANVWMPNVTLYLVEFQMHAYLLRNPPGTLRRHAKILRGPLINSVLIETSQEDFPDRLEAMAQRYEIDKMLTKKPKAQPIKGESL